uniref:CUB domain-containing protein n=1 Tax=Electrophorus electricus TaxID=8005 RepID=A0A4W4GDY5_ELEEL
MGHNGNAFYALRSCHQVLFGESGEFFSPDYLCSSPALWCNWTVQVPRGKRVQLYLEDLTPMYACHLKTDQIHLDESPVAAGESRILERCWGKARYTSITNTVHVVQLIGPNPSPPHRGFYGRFWAFGLPETFAETPAVSREYAIWVFDKALIQPISLEEALNQGLSAGALFIAWVQLGENDEVSRTLGVLHSTLQGLRGRSISPHNKSHGIVVSVSVEDIDECETQLVMCDVHADCVNEFGSYSCHCHHGYSPGLGGAVCVEAAGRGKMRATVPMLLYIICFLLCFLLALLLVVLCVLYRRYHRGAFLPRCQHGSICSDTAVANDVNNNRWGRGHKSSASPIPPPPPSRLTKSTCPAPDLPLLKFSTLVPSGGFEDKLQSERH